MNISQLSITEIVHDVWLDLISTSVTGKEKRTSRNIWSWFQIEAIKSEFREGRSSRRDYSVAESTLFRQNCPTDRMRRRSLSNARVSFEIDDLLLRFL